MPTSSLTTAADRAPTDGPWRLISPVEVAEAVWACYQGDSRLHWYVPAEIEELVKAKTVSPEAARDERIAAARDQLG